MNADAGEGQALGGGGVLPALLQSQEALPLASLLRFDLAPRLLQITGRGRKRSYSQVLDLGFPVPPDVVTVASY